MGDGYGRQGPGNYQDRERDRDRPMMMDRERERDGMMGGGFPRGPDRAPINAFGRPAGMGMGGMGPPRRDFGGPGMGGPQRQFAPDPDFQVSSPACHTLSDTAAGQRCRL